MPSRAMQLAITVTGSLLLTIFLVLLPAQSSAGEPLLRSASGDIPALTPTPTPEPQWIRTAVFVTPSLASLLPGESITVTAQMIMTGTCGFPIYDVTLRQSESLFTYVDPPESVIGPPGPNPAIWRLTAMRPGATFFSVAFFGETYCDGVWQWNYASGESPPVTVTGSLVSLPWASRELTTRGIVPSSAMRP